MDFHHRLGVGTASRARVASRSVLIMEISVKAMFDFVTKCCPLAVEVFNFLARQFRVWCIHMADVLTPHVTTGSGLFCVVNHGAINIWPVGFMPDDVSAMRRAPAEKKKNGNSSHEAAILVPQSGLYK